MNEPVETESSELAKTIAHFVRLNAALGASFAAAPSNTIRPAKQPPPRPIASVEEGLTLGHTLGEGGMGVVRLARQRVLDRDVAVKSVQPGVRSEQTTRMLLQEALILGRLEHPNILPIYDIRHEGDEPQIVLKKIDGVEWKSLMRSPELMVARFAATNALEANLGVLMQVCNAVHFAHSRGFVHRDLKPDNVMIGGFGEVYLMDWGLAVAMADDGSGRFPLARDATELAGTPNYMAPEMLGGAVSRISARTDVYLLGGLLVHIVSGRPPHTGRDMAELIRDVVVSRPVLPDRCPSELAHICRRAMAPNPDDRFESAEELRLALVDFVQHAGSRRLARQAVRRTDELVAAIVTPPPQPRELAERVQELFGECRFAYRQALATWRENDLAIAGQERALRAMIDFELSQHNPRSAVTLLASLARPEVALRARVEAAVRAAEQSEQRMDELERFKKRLDMETGQRGRAIGAVILGLVWTVAPAFGPLLATHYPDIGRGPAIAFALVVMIAMGALAQFGPSDVRESNITRWLVRGSIVAMAGQVVLELAAIALHIEGVRTEVLWPLVWFCVSAMLTAIVDARLAPMTVGFLGALFISTVRPDLRFYTMCASNLMMTVNMFAVWTPFRRKLV